MSEKFKSPCPPPTPAQIEILACLIEECAEVQQRATKMIRFGFGEVQPGQTMSNMQRLSAEVGDLEVVLKKALDVGLLDLGEIEIGMASKRKHLAKFLQQDTTP